jgi:hypothetical protein
MIRRIRDLLYEQGFTISGARNKMQELSQSQKGLKKEVVEDNDLDDVFADEIPSGALDDTPADEREMVLESAQRASTFQATSSLPTLRRELMDIRDLLSI